MKLTRAWRLAALLLPPAGLAAAPGGVAAPGAALVAPASLPPFSWEVVPRYFHADRPAGEFTDEQIEFIAGNYALVCLEKKHGYQKYGNAQDAFTRDAARLKRRNPAIRVLFYLNTIIAYRFFREDAELAQQPSWLYHDTKGEILQKKMWQVNQVDGKTVQKLIPTGASYLDIRKPEVRAWLTGIAGRMCASDGADGVFLDGSSQATGRGTLGNVQTPAERDEFRQAMLLLIRECRAAIGAGKVMLINAADAGEATTDVAKYSQLCDGIYMEPFLGYKDPTRESAARDIQTLETFGARGKLVIAKGWPDAMMVCHFDYRGKSQAEKERLARRNLDFPLACFLLGAREHAYFAYSWWYDAQDGWLLDYPALRRPLGPPLGPCEKDGWKYTRAFAHARVKADLEARTAEIVWPDEAEPGQTRRAPPAPPGS